MISVYLLFYKTTFRGENCDTAKAKKEKIKGI